MDPVTAFSLAAGVLQVVDLSFKALARCQELYKDSSLAEHRSTEETTRYLVDTVDRLKASVNRAPRPQSQDDRDIIEISTKCSSTAAELLTELEKLKLDSRGGLRQVIKKSVRAIRRAKFVKEVLNKLETYQRTLDTCILARLDSHSIQNRKDFQSLDQSVQNLVIALNQDQNTVAQLLVDQSRDLRDHIDRKLDDLAKADCDLLAQKQFTDSIFFPEILARQEQIPTAYRDTCRWIFHPPNTRSGSAGDTDPNNFSSPDSKSLSSSEIQGKEIHENSVNEHVVEYDNVKADDSHRLTEGSKGNRRGSGDGRNDYVRSPPWSSFVNWLEYGHGVYWINGKAGSGKSTLMNYITGERRTKKALTNWARSSDLLVVSFFFWNPGTGLQKSSQGLLRSLLYQIAHQRKDLTSIMIDRPSRSAKSFDGSFNPPQPHTWTEQRLLSVLRQFLDRKPSSLCICFFIDGLDEFTGEEDILLEIVRLLKDTPQAKVCVSSRPELTFQQEFRASPQLRLQDLNREDIKRMATDKLYPVLEQSFPQKKDELDHFIWQVCESAQGVFLWLEIVIKDIVKGARSADTMSELHLRLQTIPDTVEGLYAQMLNKLDKRYLKDAFHYFHLLMAGSDIGRPLTLLDLVCTQSVPWEHVLRNDLPWFNSTEFHKTCKNFETRILTRCAGLVEIGKQRYEWFPGVAKQSVSPRGSSTISTVVPTSPEEQNVSRHLRGVSFIHRTVIDHLKENHQVFFQDPNWHSAANHALARGQLGLISIVPTAISEEDVQNYVVTAGWLVKAVMSSLDSIDRFRAPEETGLDLDDVTTQMVDHTYQVISQVDVRLNGPNLGWHERYDPANLGAYDVDRLPFHDCPGFAAYFGRHSYVSRHLTLHNCPLDELNYLLACTIIGLRSRKFVLVTESAPFIGALTTIEVLLQRGADPNFPFPLRFDNTFKYAFELSAWGAFLDTTLTKTFNGIQVVLGVYTVSREQNLDQAFPWLPIWNTVMKHFLLCGADNNTSIFTPRYGGLSNGSFYELVIEESPLLCLERLISTERIPIVMDLFRQPIDILRSQGAPERRRCRLIHFGPTPEVFDRRVPKTMYEVSENRSDRFLKGWHPEEFWSRIEDREKKLLEELKADLTEDIVDNRDLILRSSFKSGRRATL